LVLLLSLEQGKAELVDGGSAKKSKSSVEWVLVPKLPKISQYVEVCQNLKKLQNLQT
jgi:hypothetical protein